MRINMRIVNEDKQLLRLFWEAKLHSAKFCSPVSPNSTSQAERQNTKKPAHQP